MRESQESAHSAGAIDSRARAFPETSPPAPIAVNLRNWAGAKPKPRPSVGEVGEPANRACPP